MSDATLCMYCNSEPAMHGYVFCSSVCQQRAGETPEPAKAPAEDKIRTDAFYCRGCREYRGVGGNKYCGDGSNKDNEHNWQRVTAVRDSPDRCGHPAEQYAGVPGGPCVRRHGHPLDHGGHTASEHDANHRDTAAEIRPCGECGAMKRLDMYGYCSVGCGTARAVAAPKYETVDHPPHYNAHPAGVECIAIIEHMTFSVGSAVKYLWRHGIKPGAGAAEDIRKAIWYLQRELERISGGVR